MRIYGRAISLILVVSVVLFLLSFCGCCFADGGSKSGKSPNLVPCFALDDRGLARPDDYLTWADAREVLSRLLSDYPVSSKARALRPLRFYSDKLLCLSDWTAALASVYPNIEISDDDTPLSRCEAASLIVSQYDEITVEQRKLYHPDVPLTADSFGFLCLLDEGRFSRTEIMEQTLDGYIWLDGYMYRVDSQGYIVIAEDADILHFDKYGQYTSGDSELDALVAEVVKSCLKPGLSRLDALYTAYEYVRDSNRYVGYQNHQNSSTDPYGENGWAPGSAKAMLQNHKGNCYYYAAEFSYIARALGYQAYARGGIVAGDPGDHGWCEIVDGDTVYICDPEMEYKLRTFGNVYNESFFMKTYEELKSWSYSAGFPAAYDTVQNVTE